MIWFLTSYFQTAALLTAGAWLFGAASAAGAGPRSQMESWLREEQVPATLLGMALAESAFDNNAHTDRPFAQQSAGLWQFLPATARTYGLQVSPPLDQRLDQPLSTRAAARFLTDLHQRFDDWIPAIAAYNAGAPAVAQQLVGVAPQAWRAQLMNGPSGRYLATVMAAIILADNADLLPAGLDQ